MESIYKALAGGVVINDNYVLTLLVHTNRQVVFLRVPLKIMRPLKKRLFGKYWKRLDTQLKLLLQSAIQNTSSTKWKSLYEEGPIPHREQHEKFENLRLTITDALNQLTHEVNKELLKKALTLKFPNRQ